MSVSDNTHPDNTHRAISSLFVEAENGPHITFWPSIVKAYGLKEAIYLSVLEALLKKGGIEIEGIKWVNRSFAEWQAEISNMSPDGIRRAFRNLIRQGIVRTRTLPERGTGSTNWYSINYEAMGELAQLIHKVPPYNGLVPLTPARQQPITPLGRIKDPIPESLRWEIWERDSFTCQICGSRRYLTIDHRHPEALGGTLDPENLQTLCRSCNSKKGARP